MPEFTLSWISDSTKGQIKSDIFKSAQNVGTDTRMDLKGNLFIALRGANFDAHNFLGQAVEKGASILLVDKEDSITPEILQRVSVVKVQDTLKALQSLAQAWRKNLTTKIMAVTGSNGKTTTKEFAATVLSQKFKVFATTGSYNNHWGLPLSILNIEKEHEIAILEMGMNHRGEIAHLCGIATPDVVLVTMVGSAHIGELGSQEEIAKAKEEIYQSCTSCLKIFNLDNEHTIGMFKNFIDDGGGDYLTFSSFDKSASVSLRVEKMELGSILLSGQINKVEGKAKVPIFGRHNVNNIMSAACLALAAGMSGQEIWQALPMCRGIWGRNQLLKLKNGSTILFDAYNASFDSMSALIKSLYEFDLKGIRLAIIGQMLELGDESKNLHEKLGELIAQTGFDTIWFIGQEKDAFARGVQRGGFDKNLLLSDSYEEKLAMKVASMLNPDDVAIIKGSRGMKMEQILDTWRTNNLL
ncbi:MAG: UDP-N-acetylmuramoyl-tripeptide--D-alanyl-D-alanine ligase [Bdellovibrionales bacterium]|nr:UDP-N-acetylmuramoyl-tripeptide--D-alanyl-D-alanine ligase [Bdellovibrionales bacterium]